MQCTKMIVIGLAKRKYQFCMDIFQHLSSIHLIVVLQLIWSVHLYPVLCRDWTMPCRTVAAAAVCRVSVPDSPAPRRWVCVEWMVSLANWCPAAGVRWPRRRHWPRCRRPVAASRRCSRPRCWSPPSRWTTTIRQLVWEHGKFGLFRLVLIRKFEFELNSN